MGSRRSSGVTCSHSKVALQALVLRKEGKSGILRDSVVPNDAFSLRLERLNHSQSDIFTISAIASRQEKASPQKSH